MHILKRHFNFLLLLFIIIGHLEYGQTNSGMNKKQYDVQTDSLRVLKLSLTNINKQMEKEIDSLRKVSDSLDKKLNKAQSELKKVQHSFYVKKYGQENGNRVFEGKVWKGMTEKMLKDSWGKPDKTHRNNYKWGVFTQWYYGNITYFFKNGKLIDWEEKK
jgi:hypothetical protein